MSRDIYTEASEQITREAGTADFWLDAARGYPFLLKAWAERQAALWAGDDTRPALRAYFVAAQRVVDAETAFRADKLGGQAMDRAAQARDRALEAAEAMCEERREMDREGRV